MPLENEVKYVLNPKFNSKALKDWELKQIRQGYLGRSAHLIREDKNAFLVYRDWAGTDRHELEIRIPVEKEDFDALWPTCIDKSVRDFYENHKKSRIEVGRLRETPRIRKYGDDYFFTYKQWVVGQDGQTEVEDTIPAEAFEDLWPNCHSTMCKDRYKRDKDDIEWVVDFMRKGGTPNGPIYFVLSEAEMPVGMDKPDKILKELRDEVIYEVPKTVKDFTSRKLCDEDYAAQKLADIGYKP